MTLDPTTLFIAGGLTIIVCGVYFILETLLRRNDTVGRLWSVFYILGIFVVFAYLVSAVDEGTWWAMAPANGGYVVAIGMLWCGARVANGRRPLVLIPFAAGVIVTVATLLPGPSGGYWAGSVEMFTGITALTGLAAFETGRRELSGLLSARVLAVMLAAVSLFYLGRTLGIVFLGVDDPAFLTFFGTEASTLFESCLVVVATITLSSIQADRFDRGGVAAHDAGDGAHLDGVLGLRVFREIAESWLLRSVRERSTLVMLVVEIADLDEINIAFGRSAGDAAIRVAGRVTTTHAPTAALIGRLSARRFALLMTMPTNDSVDAIASRIADAVLNTPIDDHDRFRVTTFRGITSTRTAGSRYDDLVRAATDAVALDAQAAREQAAAATAS